MEVRIAAIPGNKKVHTYLKIIYICMNEVMFKWKISIYPFWNWIEIVHKNKDIEAMNNVFSILD